MTDSQRSLPSGRHRSAWFLVVTLFLLVVAVALRLGLPLYRKNSAIREFRRMGGSVQTVPGGPEWLRRRIGDDRMRFFDEVVFVHLGGTAATDADISAVAEMSKLKKLNLRGTRVSDVGLDHVRRLPELEVLSLGDTRVTDAGLVKLGGLSSLNRLSLLGTGISDAGLLHLQRLANLQEVMLHGTRVTDAGLVDFLFTLPRADKTWPTIARHVQRKEYAIAAEQAAASVAKARIHYGMFWRSWNNHFWMRGDFDEVTREFRRALCDEYDCADEARRRFIAALLMEGHKPIRRRTRSDLRRFAEILPEYR